MAVSRDSVAILHMIWERDCYQAIDNLVKKDKDGHQLAFAPMFSILVCLLSQLQMLDGHNF